MRIEKRATIALMACGHSANAATPAGDPTCAICMCFEVVPNPPSLEGRSAQCPFCKTTHASDYALPFFEYREALEFDSFYDGCRGWD